MATNVKVLTLDEVIHQLLELQAAGKGNYRVTKDMSPWSGGFAIKEIQVNNEQKIVSF